MIKHDIAALIARAGQAAQDAGDLPAVALGQIPVDRSTNFARGDYASSVAMRLARAAGMPPLTIAQRIVRHLAVDPAIARVEIAAPGFINFGLSTAWLCQQVDKITAAGDDFGRVSLGNGARVQIEFVSANPTGYLTAASGRAGALGDALANLLEFAGYQSEREYYINDAGSRMHAFYSSIHARYRQLFGLVAEVPKDGYLGPAITAIAEEIKAEYDDRFLSDDEALLSELGVIAIAKVVVAIQTDLAALGVKYDRWFSEQSLFDSGMVARTVDLLRDRGHVVQRDGAVWFASSELGDERDHVLVRTNGTPTYLASDVAYHFDKLVTRKLDRVIDIWGADHHGHVPAIMAAAEAIGVDRSKLTILLHQMVTIKRGDEIVRMSKRAGDYVALRDVLDEVGRDACRYFFLSRSANAHIDFDLELASRESDDNPVYYIQYSYARTSSILRKAVDLDPSDGDVMLLTHEAELSLIRKMLQFPEVIEAAAIALEPHQLPFYARELASVFSQFYEQCRVLSSNPDDRAISLARLKLVAATRTVLANCLRLMGMSAPERMTREE